jgi:Tfp pilus assembly protein PilN
MIRVNLLGEKAKGSKGRGVQMPDFGEMTEKLRGLAHVSVFLSILGIVVPQVVVKHLISTERSKFQKTQAAQETQIADLRRRERELSDVITQIDALNQQIEETRAKVAAVERLVSTRLFPVPVLDSVSQVIPKYVWLTELSYNASATRGTVHMEGKSLTNDLLSDFLAALQEVPRFSGVQLEESVHQSEKEYDYKQFKLNLVTKEGSP